MSDWYWRALALKTAFVVTCLFSYIYAQDTVEKLPYCNPHNSGDSPVSNDLLIVSTLDGKLTAFSTQNGFKAWDLETQPLLSSNLHHVELSSGGKWVRLVPSLRGTLYSLSGDTIEPLPFDAEQLLSSSFKYSDDLVVAGARETLWIGLDSSSGTVLYECSSSGCSNEQQSATGSRFVLVLRRLANTVRALDPRSGLEKWNFSVAEHQLAISTNRECHIPNKGPVPAATVVVALPEGVVALRAPDSKLLLWQQKLEAPVAGMWRLHGDSLQPIDVLWEGSKSLTESAVLQAPPSIYIGVHEKQLYIQEGSAYGAKLDTAVGSKRSPFKLQQTRPLLASDSGPESNAVSLVTLYGNTGLSENRGFFLYLQDTCGQAVQVSDETVDDSDYFPPNDSTDQSEHHHIHVHVYSLWFWWKEVLLIAVSSALLMNLMIWPRFFAPKFRPATPLPLNKEYIVVERHYERPVVNSGTEYSGRYEKDFTPLRCLGRGGFGVVFEAKNNIDHCSYAVKRITLPKRESKRERVLREVRALAKLDHENIVRYFNAWVEEPPSGWQDQRDAIWMRELDGVSVSMSEDYTASSPLPQKKPPADTTLDLQGGLRALAPPGVDPCFDALDFEKQLTSKRHRSFSCNDSFSIVFDENASKHDEGKHSSKDLSNVSTKVASADDDSFIVFANSHDLSKHSSNVHELANKQLDVVKRSDDYTKTSESHSKKKKGHRRHWSLDLCVKGAGDGTETGTRTGTGPGGSNMYLYIQMQLCLRDSLHDWLRQNRTAHQRGDKVKGLFSQIVSAVEYVHLAGLIHRDLKPSNIFFAPDGRVKVGDFGLVTTMAESSEEGCSSDQGEAEVHTRHTYRVGTHLYMSPEQLAGRAYSFKVDIYSLGLILLELLQPFNTEAERVATLLGAREQNYPQTFMENYPETAEVLQLMLSADPSLRPTAGGVKSLALQN